MNNESFVLYESVFKQTEILEKRLGKESAFDFIKAIMEFGLYGVMPDEESAVWLYGFEQSITSIYSAKTRYEAAIENGKKGGRKKTIDENKVIELKAKGLTNKQVAEELKCSISSVEKINAKTRKNQKNLNDNVNVNVNENVNENVNVNVKTIEENHKNQKNPENSELDEFDEVYTGELVYTNPTPEQLRKAMLEDLDRCIEIAKQQELRGVI